MVDFPGHKDRHQFFPGAKVKFTIFRCLPIPDIVTEINRQIIDVVLFAFPVRWWGGYSYATFLGGSGHKTGRDLPSARFIRKIRRFCRGRRSISMTRTAILFSGSGTPEETGTLLSNCWLFFSGRAMVIRCRSCSSKTKHMNHSSVPVTSDIRLISSSVFCPFRAAGLRSRQKRSGIGTLQNPGYPKMTSE